MKSAVDANVRPSGQQLKLGRNWVMQQESDLQHTRKSTSEWLANKTTKILGWPSQSPELNSIKTLRIRNKIKNDVRD